MTRALPLAALAAAACTLVNRVDEADIPAPRAPVEICQDGIDNDGDGEIDCEDPNCREVAACQEATEAWCGDGLDNDLDGLTDCGEAACRRFAHCTEADAATCADRLDNDQDGLIDCREASCRAFPHCQEATDVACQDRLDNDEDGLTDCNDESCFRFYACFSTSPLERDTRCDGPLRPAFSLADAFEGAEIDESLWQVFHSSGADRPAVLEGGLDPGGRDDFGRAGVASRPRFRMGVDQPFALTASVRQYGPCTEPACDLVLELHTRRQWGDAHSDGESVLSIELTGAAPWALAVTCSYHGRPIEPLDSAPLDFEDAGVVSVQARLDLLTDRIDVGVGGRRICTTPVVLPAEPETSLVIHGGGPAIAATTGPPSRRLVVDEVGIEIAAQRLAARCAGIGRPLLEDGFCVPDRIDNAGMASPRAVRRDTGQGADWHIFPDLLRQTHAAIGHARSADGRTGWTASPENAAALMPDDFLDWHMGAFRHDPQSGRFEAWGRGGGLPAHRFRSAQNDAANWTSDAPLTVDDGGLDVDPQTWAPETVVHGDGGYTGWFTQPGARGRPAIHIATSEDGLHWTLDPAAVLVGGGERAWDREGVWSPSITDAGGFWILAYGSRRFGEPGEIGFAASRDGVSWTKHRDNPVVVGRTAGFDLDGVESPSLIAEGDELRLWYTAVTTSALACDGPAPSTGQQRRIGFAPLFWPVASSASGD